MKECNTKEAENQIDQKLIPYRERQDRINLNIEDLKKDNTFLEVFGYQWIGIILQIHLWEHLLIIWVD